MNKKDLSKVSIIKRMKLQNTVRKQIINLVASTLINKISYMLPKIWLPNLVVLCYLSVSNPQILTNETDANSSVKLYSLINIISRII